MEELEHDLLESNNLENKERKKKIIVDNSIKKQSVIIDNTVKKQNIYKMVDLCAGTGAFSLAFEKTGKVNTIFSNDFEKNSKIIYDENFKLKLTLKDIHDIDVKKDIVSFDILTAGFPCQPFSIAGEKQGFDDPRSNVFFKILEIMKIHKPIIFILENVKNLQSHDE